VSALARYLAFRRTLPPRPPLEHRMVRARGLDFAVYTTPVISDASPLLCINGGLLFDHTLLWPALAPLALHRQLIFYDQRGRGASDTPPGLHASRIEFDAGDVPALRAALGIDEWDLLGHSWGGGIAMLAAAQENAAATGGVRKLVLVNAVGATSDWLPPLHAAGLARLTGDARARLAACDVRQLERPELGVHADYAQAFFPAWFADADLARSVAPPRGDSVTGAHVAARLRRDGYDWIDRLRDLPVPTLVLHGAADVLPRSVAERTAQFLARAHLVPIPEAGHNPFWEAPDAFFAAVHTFLAEGVPAS
jgi:proline iminopeptidase